MVRDMNIDIARFYTLQLEHPGTFHLVLQNFCSHALDQLIRKIDEAIDFANSVPENDHQRFKFVFEGPEEIVPEIELFIVFFSYVRKSVIVKNNEKEIKGEDIEVVLQIFQNEIRKLAEKYPKLELSGMSPEDYKTERAELVSELSDIRSQMKYLDEDYLSECQRIRSVDKNHQPFRATSTE